VINPVGYGTGLKIKSVEAIAYRKPLLCTSQGWVGKLSGGVTVVKQVKDMTHVIDRWKNDNDTFQKARRAVSSSTHQRSDQVYAALLKTL